MTASGGAVALSSPKRDVGYEVIVDADAHVIEAPTTWEYLPRDKKSYQPLVVTADDGHEYWKIGERLALYPVGDPRIPRQVRECTDVAGRLAYMDDMGVDVQVVYPTLFQKGMVAVDEQVEQALCRAYNQWLADVCALSGGRIRWVAVLPLLSVPESVDELTEAAKHGACGVFLRGLEHGRLLDDPYFEPVFQRAGDLDLPVCVHAGNSSDAILRAIFPRDKYFYAVTPVLAAYHRLRSRAAEGAAPPADVGFVQAGVDWLPYVRAQSPTSEDPSRDGSRDGSTGERWAWFTYRYGDDLTPLLQTDPDLASRLIMGSDFAHWDPTTELDMSEALKQIEPELRSRISDENPTKFYNLG